MVQIGRWRTRTAQTNLVRGWANLSTTRCEYGWAIEHKLGDLELDRARVMVIIVGRLCQERVLRYRLLGTSGWGGPSASQS